MMNSTATVMPAPRGRAARRRWRRCEQEAVRDLVTEIAPPAERFAVKDK
jgi:hypothetical protein